jgi:hypothetical protein
MGKVNINYKRFAEKSKGIKKVADNVALKKYELSKNNFFKDFESHPVTKELEGGPRGSNISNTLGGIGNLFSFIGFYNTDNPIQNLRRILKDSFSVKEKRKGNLIRYIIDYPSLSEIKSETPMPWEGGRSWVTGIERGISGFSNYLYKKFGDGRSKEALQSDNKIRLAFYRKTTYLTSIINNFVNNMKSR